MDKTDEVKAALLGQLQRSNNLIAQIVANAKQIENKAYEFLQDNVSKLPQLKDQLESTQGREQDQVLNEYFKTLTNIEKCAQVIKQAREDQMEATKI